VKLLFPTDGKPPATAAGDLLINLGDRERLDITVLSVNGFATALEEGARIEHHYSPEAGRSHAFSVIDATVEKLRAHGFRADGRLAEGWPPDEILGEIEGSRYDMTLMGSGSASWLGRVLLGSVATKVLHASTSSVLIAHNAPGDGLPQVLYGTDGSRGAQFALRALMEFAEGTVSSGSTPTRSDRQS
jgi:nucleotide-binding universal stress UspA family protein